MVLRDFPEEQQEVVIGEISTVQLRHVMAESEYNLLNTHLAILTLAVGNIEDFRFYVERAKIDFRDVIMWAMSE